MFLTFLGNPVIRIRRSSHAMATCAKIQAPVQTDRTDTFSLSCQITFSVCTYNVSERVEFNA